MKPIVKDEKYKVEISSQKIDELKDKVVETEHKVIDLTIPETAGVDVKLRVGLEIVTKDDDGLRGVAYDRLGVVALAGIDKLYEMVQELQRENKELRKRIEDLEK